MTSTASLNTQVATVIRVQLAARNIQQGELAKLCGWTASSLSRRMTGEIPFNTDDLDKLAYVLNMSVAELTNPVQRPIPPQPPMTDRMAGQYLKVLDGCQCGGIGETGSHAAGCQWAAVQQ